VIFDVAICGALLYLSAHWNSWLADLLAVLVTLDAVLTLIQAVGYDLPRHPAPFDWMVMAVAVLAPTLAATLLWSGRAHRQARGGAGG